MFAFWVNSCFNLIQFWHVICQNKTKVYFVPSELDFIWHNLQNTISNALATAKAQQAPIIMWQSPLSSVMEGKTKAKTFWYWVQIKAFTMLSNQHDCQLQIAAAVVYQRNHEHQFWFAIGQIWVSLITQLVRLASHLAVNHMHLAPVMKWKLIRLETWNAFAERLANNLTKYISIRMRLNSWNYFKEASIFINAEFRVGHWKCPFSTCLKS